MFNIKEALGFVHQTETSEDAHQKTEAIQDGKTVHFQIKTELGYFSGILAPEQHQINEHYRNSWVLSVDFIKAIQDVEQTGGYANRNAYYKKGLKLAENIMALYKVTQNSNDCVTQEKIEFIVYKR